MRKGRGQERRGGDGRNWDPELEDMRGDNHEAKSNSMESALPHQYANKKHNFRTLSLQTGSTFPHTPQKHKPGL